MFYYNVYENNGKLILNYDKGVKEVKFNPFLGKIKKCKSDFKTTNNETLEIIQFNNLLNYNNYDNKNCYGKIHPKYQFMTSKLKNKKFIVKDPNILNINFELKNGKISRLLMQVLGNKIISELSIKGNGKSFDNEKQLLICIFNFLKNINISLLTSFDNSINFLFDKFNQNDLFLNRSKFQIIDYQKIFNLCFNSNLDIKEIVKNELNMNFKDNLEFKIETISKLEKENKCIHILLQEANDNLCLINDILTPINFWEIKIYQHLFERNILIDPRKDQQEVNVLGGYFTIDKFSHHKKIKVYDIRSSYPSHFLKYKISPDNIVNICNVITDKTLIQESVEYLCEDINRFKEFEKDNLIYTPNNIYYKNENGFLTDIIQELYDKRIFYKNKHLQN